MDRVSTPVPPVCSAPARFGALIALWPSIEDFCADLNGLPIATARAWARRDSIPSGWWLRIVDAARVRGFSTVTFRLLAELAARTPPNAANDAAATSVDVRQREAVVVGDGFSMDSQMGTGPAGRKGE
jgi:hypothetical protein